MKLIYRQFAIVGALVCLNLVSASMVLQVAHQNRLLYNEIEILNEEKDAMETRRGQLLLELGSLAAHGRIERHAREKLNMFPPLDENVLTLIQD